MENLKTHDKVIHPEHGNGEVVIIDPKKIRPICVIFDGGVCVGFKKDGAEECLTRAEL